MRKTALLYLLLCTLAIHAQHPINASRVAIVVNDSAYDIQPVTTQSEWKPGWKIVDYQTKGKTIRYLWGAHARQWVEEAAPRFILRLQGLLLQDFALIKLRERKQYRRFSSDNLLKCAPKRIDLDFAKIIMTSQDEVEFTPLQPLPTGEYVLVNLKGSPVNDMGDVEVYPFQVPPKR